MTAASPTVPAPLRPLGLGEILDRAVNLSIRSFVVLATINLVTAIPLAISRYVTFAVMGPVYLKMFEQIRRGATTGAATPPVVPDASTLAVFPIVGLVSLIVLLAVPLMEAALIYACASIYFGTPTTFKTAYRYALDRWLPLFLLFLIWFVAAIAVMIVLFLAVLLTSLAFAGLVALSHAAGAIIGILVFLVFFVASIFFGSLAILTFQLSVVACTLERTAPFTAFKSSLRRVSSGTGVRRVLLFGFVMLAIYVGISLASFAGSALMLGFVHWPLLGTLYEMILGIASQIIVLAFVTIFYFDLRVREDGLDLEVAAAAPPPLAGTV